jgi:hypothetical protein
MLPPILAYCLGVIRCYFCDKKYLLRFAFYHTSPEVLLNIRLTALNYTLRLLFLQGVLRAFFIFVRFLYSPLINRVDESFSSLLGLGKTT